MRFKLPVRHIALILVSVLAAPALANTPAPKGWKETTEGQVRILTMGPAQIEIGSWADLSGQPLDKWLRSFERTTPPPVASLPRQLMWSLLVAVLTT